MTTTTTDARPTTDAKAESAMNGLTAALRRHQYSERAVAATLHAMLRLHFHSGATFDVRELKGALDTFGSSNEKICSLVCTLFPVSMHDASAAILVASLFDAFARWASTLLSPQSSMTKSPPPFSHWFTTLRRMVDPFRSAEAAEAFLPLLGSSLNKLVEALDAKDVDLALLCTRILGVVLHGHEKPTSLSKADAHRAAKLALRALSAWGVESATISEACLYVVLGSCRSDPGAGVQLPRETLAPLVVKALRRHSGVAREGCDVIVALVRADPAFAHEFRQAGAVTMLTKQYAEVGRAALKALTT